MPLHIYEIEVIKQQEVGGWAGENGIPDSVDIEVPSGWEPLGLRMDYGLPVLDVLATTPNSNVSVKVHLVKLGNDIPAEAENYSYIGRWRANQTLTFWLVFVPLN